MARGGECVSGGTDGGVAWSTKRNARVPRKEHGRTLRVFAHNPYARHQRRDVASARTSFGSSDPQHDQTHDIIMAHVTFAVAVVALLLATHGVAPLARAQDEGCTDELPPSVTGYTCADQAGWGKCGESWMDGFCLASCGTCDTASAPATEEAATEEIAVEGEAPVGPNESVKTADEKAAPEAAAVPEEIVAEADAAANATEAAAEEPAPSSDEDGASDADELPEFLVSGVYTYPAPASAES